LYASDETILFTFSLDIAHFGTSNVVSYAWYRILAYDVCNTNSFEINYETGNDLWPL